MKAIITKYHGPTDTRGSRISASDHDGNRITIPYPYELSGEAVHLKAAEALRNKMNWTGTLVGGAIKGGYAFVFVGLLLVVLCGAGTAACGDVSPTAPSCAGNVVAGRCRPAGVASEGEAVPR